MVKLSAARPDEGQDSVPSGTCDRELMADLKNGDEAAFKKVYDLFSRRLYGFAFTYFKSKEIAEELVHDVFLKIWEHRATLDETRSFDSFVFAIARNKIIDTIRRHKHQRLYQLHLAHFQELSHNAVEEDMAYADYTTVVQEAIAQLPLKRKLIFTLSREQNMSYAEIAAHLGISQKTVEAQMTKALKCIKQHLYRHSDILASLLWVLLFL